METQLYDSTLAKKSYSRVGLALFVFTTVTIVAQSVLGGVYAALVAGNPALGELSWLRWLVTFAPIYVIGVPCGLLVMRGEATYDTEEEKMTFGRFVMFFFICLPIMYVGNIIGNIFSAMISGGTAVNPLERLAFDSSPVKVLVVAVLAPIFEELMFRRLIVDHTIRYGEPAAIIFSGVAFGFFHMNFFQFFYAFGLGCLFAYVYVRTRKLRWSIILHMIINFMGSVIAPALLSGLDLELLSDPNAIANLSEEALMEIAPSMLAYFAYTGFILTGSVVGLVLIITRWRKLHFNHMPEEMPRDTVFRTAYLNLGAILFFAVCFIMTVLNLVLPFIQG
ncbi:MAG: CPBP family intramembrane metalloprotease [Oscillospiraceae bacterium]|nr:CPBP family intramembrane metalloprotease [Oscillospiraceae bacterium]